VAPGTYKNEAWNTAPPLHTSYVYSWTGQLYEVSHPDGSKERTFYRYLQTATVDANHHLTIVEVDGLGRTVSVKQYEGSHPDGPTNWEATAYAEAKYEYDVADRLDQVILPDDSRIDPTYDLLGRKTQMSDPDMGTWTYAYDAAGNLIRQTDARGTTLCYEYDALNRLRYVREDQTVPKDCTGTLVWRTTHEYDTLNWQPVNNGIGRRNRLNDGSGTTTWTYDARGRVTQETKVINGTGGGTFVTGWTYDSLDRVVTMTYPGGNNGQTGEVVRYTYNPQGLLERMFRSTPTPVYDYVGRTDYNALGQVIERRLGSGDGVLRQSYTYTATENYRLVSLKSGTNSPDFNNRQNISYTYDDAGNILSITDVAAVGGSQTQSFTYDTLNRLKTAQATGGSHGVYSLQWYTYTVAGNIESFEGTAFAYQDTAHKHAVTHLGGVQRYWYDANGNVIRRINFGLDVTYSYDAENRLVGVSGSRTATFTYDGDGKLVKMQVGSTYVAIAGPHYQHSGSTGTKYYYAGSVRLAERIGSTLYWLLTDHLGSTAVTTDAGGAYVTELRYLPYGRPRYNPGNQKADYRFTGQRWQNEIGLYHYGARWYDHLIGRFLQPDPLVPEPGNPQALNRYAYVRNNPLRYTDPSGHCEFDASGNITRFDCYAYEFEKLSAADRIKWVEAMMRLSGATGWFNNIIDIIKYFEQSPILHHMAPGSWASWADAGVLQAIQNGWVLYTGGTPVSTSGGAAQLWADFFKQGVSIGFSAEAVLKPYWGKAEQAGVDYGVALADRVLGGRPGGEEGQLIDVFVRFGNAYRSMVGTPYGGGLAGAGLFGVAAAASGAALCPGQAKAACAVGGGLGGGLVGFAAGEWFTTPSSQTPFGRGPTYYFARGFELVVDLANP
jgi:RHS repeat-associated protein